MTGSAQGNEIARAVSAGLSALNMVDMQNLVFGFPMAALTLVLVSEKNVLAHVVESFLLTILIVCALRPGGVLNVSFKPLCIKLCSLNANLGDRQDGTRFLNQCDMCVELMFDRWCQPAFVFAMYTVVKSCRAMTCFSVSSRSSKYPPFGQVLDDIGTALGLCRKQFLFFR